MLAVDTLMQSNTFTVLYLSIYRSGNSTVALMVFVLASRCILYNACFTPSIYWSEPLAIRVDRRTGVTKALSAA